MSCKKDPQRWIQTNNRLISYDKSLISMKKFYLFLFLISIGMALPLSGQTIETRVWDDSNANGKQDVGEPNIVGATVELRKPGGNLITTTTTDATGIATFNNVTEPSVKLRYQLPNADTYAFTLKDNIGDNNRDSDVDRNSGETEVFSPSGTITDIDCGLWSPGSVIARVWDDRNANGRQDTGEPGIAGVNVRLEKSGGNLIVAIPTNGNGDAVFSGVVPADRDVKLDFELINSDYAFTLQDNIGDDNKDSDANRSSGETVTFRTTGAGLPVTEWDAGFWTPGTVEAFVWDDRNGNGRQDSGEDGIAGINVRLERSGGNLITQVQTDANGVALFNAVVPADSDVKLDFELPDGNHAFTLQDNIGDDNKDSDADRSSGETATFRTTGAGLTVTEWDAGLWTPGTVEAYVWDDLNGNGRQDSGENGIAGINVRLERSGGNLITQVQTDANGVALFNAVVPADSDVKLDFEIPADHAFTLKDNIGDDNKDSDADRISGETETFRTIGAGLTVTKWDAGLWTPGEIITLVWDDANGNGRQDNNEWGVPNVKVEVKRSGGNLLTTAFTNSKGEAVLKDIPADQDFKLDYHVPSFASGFTGRQTIGDKNKDSDPKTNNGETDVFRTVRGNTNPGEFAFDITSLDAGLTGLDYTSDGDNDGIPDFMDKYPNDNTNNGKGVILSYVWDDLDADGRQDNGEPGIDCAKVTLKKTNGNPITSDYTHGANGLVAFFDIDPGTSVKLDFDLKDENHAYTHTDNIPNDNLDSDARRNNGETDVFVVNGIVTEWDCGQWSPGSVEAFVWDDLNANGRQDNGEPGIDGVTVYLKKSNGTAISQTTTKNGGIAKFNAKVPADKDVKLDFDLKDANHAYTLNKAIPSTTLDSDARRNNGETDVFRTTGAGLTETSFDCGQWSPGSVEAFVWDDLNANGRQDNGEPGIEGVNVILRRSNGTQIINLASDANGIAKFMAVVPADQDVKLDFDLKDANHAYTLNKAIPSTTLDSDARRNNGETDVFRTTGAGLTETSFDCGQWSPGSVEAFVWDDLNANGRQDNGEPGIQGVNVILRRSNGTQIINIASDANGIAKFMAVVPADQDVKLDFDLKDANHAYTLNKAIPSTTLDSDARRNNGETDVFRTTGAGLTETSFDCGQWSPGSVEAFVWDDLNGNGRQDNNEPGIQGVNVILKKSNGTPITNIATDANGIAYFKAVVPADSDVKLDFDLKDSDHAYTYKDRVPNDAKDSDARRNNGETDIFRTTGAGLTETSFDCGQWSPGEIYSYVWDDANGNGKQDNNEWGIPNVKVEVKKSNGTVIATGFTDVKGMVILQDIPADQQFKLDYHVPAFASGITTKDAIPNDSNDSDARPNNGETDVFRTVRGQSGNGEFAFDINSIDCGMTGLDYVADTDNDDIPDFLDKYPNDDTNNGLGAIYARAWDDQDGDGRQGAGEPGIDCAPVKLRRGNNTLGESFTHPATGGVAFFDIALGQNVYLDFDLLKDHAFTIKDANNNNKDLEDSDVSRDNGRTGDFAIHNTSVITRWDAGYWAPGSVKAFVWDDQDGDGRQGANEPAVKGVVVKLRRGNNTIKTLTTNGKGLVHFRGLVPADTDVYLDFDIPAGYAFTIKDANNNNKNNEDSDADRNNGRTADFKTNKGSQLIENWDAGVWAPGSVEAFVWDDQDGDGRQGANEPGVANVEVKLRRGNNTIETLNTDADGKVLFNGNVPADTDVYLDFNLPSGYAFTQKDANNNNKDNEDSDADRNNGQTATFKTTKGSHLITNWDAGVWAPGSVEAFVWDDQDGDGRQGANEPGVANVEVKLRRGNNTIETLNTDADGKVLFNGNVPADTDVYLDFNLPSGYAFTQKDANNNNKDNEDSDADRNNGQTATFKTTKGSHLITNWDAGVWAPGSVTTFVWDDQNGDGRQGGSEPAVSGVTVKLRRGNNTLQTAQTGADGLVTFNGVPADTDVYLDFDLPAGYAFTQKDANNNNKDNEDSDAARSNGQTDEFKLTKGSQNETSWDAGVWAPGTINAYVWEDQDGNGRQGANEPAVANVQVKLRRGNNTLQTVNTDANGIATFTNVPADTDVYLDFDAPSGFSFTQKDANNNNKDNEDSDADPGNGQTDDFKTSRGSQVIDNYDAGLVGNNALVTLPKAQEDHILNLVTGELKLYPVPAVTILNVELKIEKAAETRYMITDMTGRLLAEGDWSLDAGLNKLNLDVTQLRSGMYQLIVISNDMKLNKAFTIVK